MPVIQNIISLDDLHSRVEKKIMLNDLKLEESGIKDLIYSTYDDEISLIPQCSCGHYAKGYLLDRICPVCGTPVVDMSSSIDPILWVRKFDDELPFVNPKFWVDLTKLINTKVDSLRWLSDSSYNPPKVPPVLHNIKELIGGREYINVINNLEKIIIYLKHNSQFKAFNKQMKLEKLHKYFIKKKDDIFSTNLPLINKKLFVVENTNKGNYTNLLLADIIDLALLAITTNTDVNATKKKLGRNTAKLISLSANLYVDYVKNFVSKKGGLSRKNIFGTRAHFTFRTVISTLRSEFEYDTIHVPWDIGLTTFRPHVLNKLYALGYNHKDASALVYESTFNYNEVIDKILQELIDESPYKGIPVLANRNPSLGVGSIVKVFITRFKTNVHDHTTGFPLPLMPSLNADVDGDELNFTVLTDNMLAELAEAFNPFRNVPELDIYKISGNLNIAKTSILTLMSYLDTNEEAEDEEDLVYDMLTM